MKYQTGDHILYYSLSHDEYLTGVIESAYMYAGKIPLYRIRCDNLPECSEYNEHWVMGYWRKP